MLVSNLQQFLLLLLPPLREVGITAKADESVTKSLEALAASLTPFNQLSLDQLSELLRAASHYRETGELPDWVLGRKPGAPAPRKSAPKASKVKLTKEEALRKLGDLMSRAQDLDSDRIASEVETLNGLSAEDLKAVQAQFLGNAGSKDSKPKRIEAIKERIMSHRRGKQQGQDIDNI
ncbi:MAG: hypothetical protein ACP5XB_02760 [Isosphaeraceae bacterium]